MIPHCKMRNKTQTKKKRINWRKLFFWKHLIWKSKKLLAIYRYLLLNSCMYPLFSTKTFNYPIFGMRQQKLTTKPSQNKKKTTKICKRMMKSRLKSYVMKKKNKRLVALFVRYFPVRVLSKLKIYQGNKKRQNWQNWQNPPQIRKI